MYSTYVVCTIYTVYIGHILHTIHTIYTTSATQSCAAGPTGPWDHGPTGPRAYGPTGPRAHVTIDHCLNSVLSKQKHGTMKLSGATRLLPAVGPLALLRRMLRSTDKGQSL